MIISYPYIHINVFRNPFHHETDFFYIYRKP